MNEKEAQVALLCVGYEHEPDYKSFVFRSPTGLILLSVSELMIRSVGEGALGSAIHHFCTRAKELRGEREGEETGEGEDSGLESRADGIGEDGGAGEGAGIDA